MNKLRVIEGHYVKDLIFPTVAQAIQHVNNEAEPCIIQVEDQVNTEDIELCHGVCLTSKAPTITGQTIFAGQISIIGKNNCCIHGVSLSGNSIFVSHASTNIYNIFLLDGSLTVHEEAMVYASNILPATPFNASSLSVDVDGWCKLHNSRFEVADLNGEECTLMTWNSHIGNVTGNGMYIKNGVVQ